MERYLIFCVLIVVCAVHISRVFCIPESYRERLNLPASILDVQTMTVGKTQELPGELRTTGLRMPNTSPTTKTDDDVSTVGEKRVVKDDKDDFKSTSTKRVQVDQGRDLPVRVELPDTHRDFHMNQTPASLLHQAIATKESIKEPSKAHIKEPSKAHIKEPSKAHINVDKKELINEKQDELINVESKEPPSVVKVDMQQLELTTESPAQRKEESRSVVNKMTTNHDALRMMFKLEEVKGMPDYKTVKELGFGASDGLNHHELVRQKPNYETVRQMLTLKGMPIHGGVKEIPNHEKIRGMPNHKGIPIHEMFNTDEIKWMSNYQTIRDFLSGKDISASLEGMGIPHLPGFDGTKGNVMLESNVVKPALGDKEMKWIIRVQQVVFDDGDDVQASKSDNKKLRLAENIFNRINNGLDVFRDISPGNNRRHLLQFNDKDSPDASNAGKEPEKDKASPSSDSTDTRAESTDEATSGKLTPDSPNLDSTIQKTMPEKGDTPPAQDQPAGKAYGSYDMPYPFRHDLQMDVGGGSNLKLSGDLFPNQRMDPRMEEAVSNLKQNYMTDFFKNRIIGSRDIDYGNRNDDDGGDEEHFNELIRGGENDQREFKSAREARLMKRSVRDVLDKLDTSGGDDNDESRKDSSVYKRSVHETPRSNGVYGDNEETSKDSPNSRLHKRYAHDLPDYYGASVQNDNAGTVKDSLKTRLRRKRSVHAMPEHVGRLFNDERPGSAKVSRFFKRSVQDIFDEVGEPVNEDNVETPKRAPDRSSYKKPEQNIPDDFGTPDIDDNLTPSESRLFKRSAHEIPGDRRAFVNAGKEETATDSRLHKRSAEDLHGDFGAPVNDDNDDSPTDSQKFRLFKRSVEDLSQNNDATLNYDNEDTPNGPRYSRLFKRSLQDPPRDYDASSNDDSEDIPKFHRDSRLFKRSVPDMPRDYDTSDDNEETPKAPRDSRLYKRSVHDLPPGIDASANDDIEDPRNNPRDYRLLKRSVKDLPPDVDASANDDFENPRDNPRDGRLFKRSVDDVSGKYGVSVNDEDGSPKEYDIEIDNGVKHARFPTEEKPLLLKRDISSSGSETFGSGRQHNSQESGYHHRHNNTWTDGAMKEAQNSDLNKIHHGDNGEKIFVSGEGTPALVGLVLIPVNSDGTIKEDKESDSTSNAQYHHPGNHHRRPCNGSHGHHGLPHNTDHNTHPCHHGHRKGHHHRHRPMEHHVVGRTDSQEAQNYHSESHTSSDDQHGDSHSEKHVGSGHHHSAHRGDYEKGKPHSESPGGFHNPDPESHSTKDHHGDHGSGQASGKRGEVIVESIRTEQITSGHAQRSVHPGNAVHVLVILSIFLICFTVILFLVARSRSGGSVREINSRTALYVPQAKY